MPKLTAARYGKDNIRLYKVEKDEVAKTATVYEMTVCVLLEGEIEASSVCTSKHKVRLANGRIDIPKPTTARS